MGHRYARENFSIHQMVNNYESIYKKIVKTMSNQDGYDNSIKVCIVVCFISTWLN